MERMATRDREIHLVTGHNGAGKSYYFQYLSSLPEYQGPRVFIASKDTVYVRYYAERTGKQVENNQSGYLAIYNTITQQDRFYTDELLRVDTERAILVNKAERVLLDVVMRTRLIHQKPFVAMVKKTERWLRLIEIDLAKLQGLLPPYPPSSVNLRVVFLFCDFETVQRRLTERWKNLPNDHKLPPSFVESTMGLQMPTAYQFLALNTSELGLVAGDRRKQEIKNFFAGKMPAPELIKSRAEEAKFCIMATKREIRKLLHSK